MSFLKRTNTFFELRVDNPATGVVFVHTVKPNTPFIVCRIDENENIYRTSINGNIEVWGNFDDWRDEIRRRTIEVVYNPYEKKTSKK
jgi:hypothetical protein